MALSTRSRRSLLAGLAGASLGGCLDTDTEREVLADHDLTTDISSIERSQDVTLAHWLPEGAFASVVSRADSMSEVGVSLESAPNRETLEQRVADALVVPEPPELIHTVLGGELRRYANVSEIHTIPDLMGDSVTSRLRTGIADLCAVDGAYYAVPISVTPLNILLVEPDGLPIGPTEIRDLSTFIDLIERTGLALRRTGQSVLHLLELVLLSVAQERGHTELRTGELSVDVLRQVAMLCGRIIDHVEWLPRYPNPVDLHEAVLILYDTMVPVISEDRLELRPFPGTADHAIVQATGLCLAKRGRHPGVAADVLDVVIEPDIHRAIATASQRLPPVRAETRLPEPIVHLGEHLHQAEHIVPAIHPGCGVNSDDRWRSIRMLAPESVERQSPEQITDALRDALL